MEDGMVTNHLTFLSLKYVEITREPKKLPDPNLIIIPVIAESRF
jgi:hypothetical protein